MRIKNHTHWRTDDIRRAILPAIRRRLVEVPTLARPETYRRLEVTIVYGNKGPTGVGGFAYYHRPDMTLTVGKAGPIDAVDLASVAGHEADHNRGLKHGDMPNGGMHQRLESWSRHAVGMTIRRAGPPQQDRATRAADRRDRRRRTAELKVVEWTRKTRLARTKLTKWQRALRRLEGGTR